MTKLKDNRKSLKEQLTVAHITIVMFLSVIFIGTFLLLLPFAHKKPLSLVDAFFTATSSTCVTGLLTVNVSETFTLFGQTVIMLLIEIGAIGIISVSTVFLLILGKSVSMRDTSVVHETFSASLKINVRKLVFSIFTFLFVFEVIGAIVFTLLWLPKMGFKDALFNGVFHSVSAFCNAGVSTFVDGLDGFEWRFIDDTMFSILIIFGGLGFMTNAEIFKRFVNYFKNRNRPTRTPWSLQTRIVVLVTVLSISITSALLFIFELDGAHSGKPYTVQVMSAIFHATSARTAGFNNIEISSFSNSTLYLFILLMFIGGAPVSTAGGIKVTTFALLIGMAASKYRGYKKIQIFNRSIPETVISRAIAILFISVTAISVSIFLLLLTESQYSGTNRAGFIEILFEVVSAFGTVGLSMGITPSLSVAGKIIISLLMLLGRLGPITVALAVRTVKTKSEYNFAEESVMVG